MSIVSLRRLRLSLPIAFVMMGCGGADDSSTTDSRTDAAVASGGGAGSGAVADGPGSPTSDSGASDDSSPVSMTEGSVSPSDARQMTAEGGARDADSNASCQVLPSGALTRYTGNPLLKNGPETYDFLKTGPRVVLKEGATQYRMWYEAVGNNGITSVGHATSSNGSTWTKGAVVMSPSLAWEKSEVSPQTILVENGVYKLWYHGGGYPSGNQRLGNALIGYATSSDGLSWTKRATEVLDLGPSSSFDDDQVAEARVLKIGNGYRMYYTGHKAGGGQSLGMAMSSDGISWTKYAGNPILDQAAWGNFWGGAFFYENNRWIAWHGVSAGASSSLYFMSSADGITWQQGPSNPVLTQSTDSKAADYGLVGDSVSGYRDGSTYRIMYTGFNSNLFGTGGRFEGICMASIAAPCP